MQSIEKSRHEARTFLAAGDLGKALATAADAARTAPDDVELLWILGEIHERAGALSELLKICRRLSKLTPGEVTPRLKAGEIAMQLMDLSGAEADFHAVLEVDPANEMAQERLTNVLRLAGKVDDARAMLRRQAAAAKNPKDAAIARFKAAFTQPVIARGREEFAEARANYALSLAQGPEAPIDDPLRAGLGPNFYLGYQAHDDRLLQEALARYFQAATPSLAFTARHVGRAGAGRKLRVGIISNFFSHHTVGYLSYGLVAGMDRSRFDLTLFRTPHAAQDSGTPRFLAAAPCIDLPDDLARARAVIAEAELDILHYPEIGMDHLTYFLAFARLATLQTMAWGHPVTSGLPTIDLFLSVADMEPREAEAHYSEKLAPLRGLSFSAEPAARLQASRAEVGLEAARPAYVCPQSLYKIHPDFDAIVAHLLTTDREGVVYFVSLGAHTDATFKERLARTVDGDMDRVRILPRTTKTGFLKLVSAADTLLDVPQWSGGKTSLDAFAAGTPIVHLPGDFMRGRHTLAFYRRMGIAGPIAASAADYVDIAVRLTHDTAFRTSVRDAIANAQPRLFGDWASIREIEEVWSAAHLART